MSRRHPKRRLTGKHFAMVPVEVLTSDAYRKLPNYAKVVLFAVAGQYRGNNNGDLAMTWAIGRPFGVSSKEHLVSALAMLIDRGLIAKTRQGGKRPLGPSLYALTWMPIDDLKGKIDCGPTMVAANTWALWTAPSGLPADQSTVKQRDCRRTRSGLPADQTSAVSGLPGDQTGPSIGTAGSPPSISPREGACRSNGADDDLVLPAGVVRS